MEFIQEDHDVARQIGQALETYVESSSFEINEALETAGDFFGRFLKARQRCKDVTSKNEITGKFKESWKTAVESLLWSYEGDVKKLQGQLLQSWGNFGFRI